MKVKVKDAAVAAAARALPPPHRRAAPHASSPPSAEGSRGGLLASASKAQKGAKRTSQIGRGGDGSGREVGGTVFTAFLG